MSQSFVALFFILIAFVAANLPFLFRRRWLFLASELPKSLGFRFLELATLYIIVGFFGFLLENSVGQPAPQGWEFYAITVTLFLTFSFPGFCYRYLFKH